MTKVLVTGATGFIGSNLVKKLKQKKCEINVLVRGTRQSELFRNAVQVFIGDIRDPGSVNEAVRGVDIIFNCAAVLPHHMLRDEEYWSINVTGVKNIINACKRYNVKRLVHISTVGIYGPTRNKIISERSRRILEDIYSKSKAAGEDLVWEAIRKDGIQATIIKPTIGYGPGDTRPGFLNLFRLIKKGVFIPIGKGKNFFHTVYIDNLVSALLLASWKREAIGEDFIIGDDPCPRMKTILKRMAKIMDRPLPALYISIPVAFLIGGIFDIGKRFKIPTLLSTQRVRFITENRKFSIDKARRVLGYKPNVNLEEGLRRTNAWYEANGYL